MVTNSVQDAELSRAFPPKHTINLRKHWLPLQAVGEEHWLPLQVVGAMGQATLLQQAAFARKSALAELFGCQENVSK